MTHSRTACAVALAFVLLSVSARAQDASTTSDPSSTAAVGIRWTDLDARASARLLSWLWIGVDAGYFMPSVRHGRDDLLRTIGDVYTDATAPGLARQPNFAHEGVFAGIDSRDAEGVPTRGGFYRAAYSIWDDKTFNTFDFQRFDVDPSHFVSIARNDVVAMQLRLMYASTSARSRTTGRTSTR